MLTVPRVCAALPSVYSREQQRAGQLELKIAEMTDRAKDFENMKNDLMARVTAAKAETQDLKRENDEVSAGTD